MRSAEISPAHAAVSRPSSAMTEIGVDMGTQYPKPLTDDVVAAADVVVAMGCGDRVVHLSRQTLSGLDGRGPQGRPLDEVRAIRDDLDARVRGLLTELTTERV